MSQQTLVNAAFVRVVQAINAVDTSVKALPPSVAINDGAVSAAAVWSSTKTQTQITAAVAALINGAGLGSDTLKELADSIAALVQADNGLVSTVAAQAFNAAQQLQACQNIGVGNPAFDYVPGIAATLNAGL